MNYFLISPVRGITDGERDFLRSFVAKTRADGNQIHFPLDDTVQDDRIGLFIQRQNLAKIVEADVVLQYYSPTSKGSLFDDGMVFYLGKPLTIVNPEAVGTLKTPIASFLRWYALKSSLPTDMMVVVGQVLRRGMIPCYAEVPVEWKGPEPGALFDLGMLFAAGKPIVLMNKVKATPEKSFENVLIALDRMRRIGALVHDFGAR